MSDCMRGESRPSEAVSAPGARARGPGRRPESGCGHLGRPHERPLHAVGGRNRQLDVQNFAVQLQKLAVQSHQFAVQVQKLAV